MGFFRRFTFLVCAPVFDADDLEGHRLGEITVSIEKMGFQVVRARRIEDAEMVVQTDAAIGCMVVDWGKKGLEGKTASLINLMRRRGLEMPIVILVRRKRLQDIPVELMDFIDGYIFLSEETPEFIAKNLVSRLKQYAETLKTPFFGELVDYAEEGNQLWTCPGHNGGIFYNRSPIGRIFVEHLGEAVFRDDLDNSVLDLGDLLVHEGPALKAQKEAAVIFGAEKTYFVLNGTSSSNKIVLQALVAEGDLVLFDRNNHKAAHHGALFLGNGVPIYLETDRNAHGLIGPIFHEALDETAIREKIRTNPLVQDKEAWKRERPFRVAVIEQCTYDGTINDARLIVEKIGHLCDYILFDEAWAGFMKFHPLYAGRFAMGLTNLKIMIPFVRTVAEAAATVALLAENGLRRGENGLEVVMMCEIPSNALLADAFLDHFDGFSIGSNDLTQLTLGVDRDSALVAGSFDERDPAVLDLLERAIEACNRRGKYIGICGQGPSDHPELAAWLLERGIGSMSLNADAIVETWLRLAASSQDGALALSRGEL